MTNDQTQKLRPQGSRATIHLISGLPGFGKSTFGRHFATTSKSIRFCPDEWLYEWRLDYTASETRVKIEDFQLDRALLLARAGQDSLLEWGFWAKYERLRVRDIAHEAGARVELHFLDAHISVLWNRLVARNANQGPGDVPFTFEELHYWENLFQKPEPAELLTYDDYHLLHHDQ